MSFKKITINNYFFRSVVISGTLLATSIPFNSASMAASNNTKNYQSNNSNIELNNTIATTRGVNIAALNLVKQYEGFRSYAYIDTSGYPVIGYGQSRIRGRRVRMGQRISRAEADAELARELYQIQRIVRSKVKVGLNPNQLGALTSLVYNAGVRILTHSTLIRKLNAGNYMGAANEMLRWNKAHQGGRLVPLAGLTRRRQAERRLFLTPHR
ncbi:MAG: lysozyme [Xenococcaceae cyanobacterium MO_167.B52]|nr:lysozyme [Xenococcaceae cyanobacterium MO_167.B52]